MNKGLEALEKLNHTICLNLDNKTLVFGLDKYDNCDCKDIYEFSKCYEFIETALKNYEKLNHDYSIVVDEKVSMACEYAKKLKALEIIKNKVFPLCYVKSHTWEQYRNSCFSKEKNALTQEEYDLLKEVLL